MRDDGAPSEVAGAREAYARQARLDDAVLAEQLRVLAGRRADLYINLVMAAVVALTVWRLYPAWIPPLWLGLLTASVLVRYRLKRRYGDDPPGFAEARRRAAHFVAAAITTGCLWGAAASIIVITPQPAYQLFIIFALGGMTVGGMILNASYPAAMFGFMAPAMLPTIVALFVRADLLRMAMGLMLTAFVAAMVNAGRDIHRSLVEGVRLRLDQEALMARALHLARCDTLTGLANRGVFVEAVAQAIDRAQGGGDLFAVLYLDLDRFKDINDTLGHPTGDEMLMAVADRLRVNTREGDTVARFGGDEFAVVAGGIAGTSDAAALATALIRVMGEPFVIGGNHVHSGVSVGVHVWRPGDRDPETLLSYADLALYQAKVEGRGLHRFFTDAMETDVRARVALGSELREAIARDQLFLQYQPQVALADGRITGLEALVRWRHPERGVLGPDTFIPVAEQTGLIGALGHWVLWAACRQSRAWLDAGLDLPRMCVNVSALQFKASLALEADIAAVLAETGLPPERLELELTETVMMSAAREHGDVLARIGEAGVTVAIDDFGTGYSSLAYLRRFPTDRIKIAHTFVRQLKAVGGDAAIVKATLGLARELGIMVIAEGVETLEQLELLKGWGCAEGQGFYFARPLDPQDVPAILQRGAEWPRAGWPLAPDGQAIQAEAC